MMKTFFFHDPDRSALLAKDAAARGAWYGASPFLPRAELLVRLTSGESESWDAFVVDGDLPGFRTGLILAAEIFPDVPVFIFWTSINGAKPPRQPGDGAWEWCAKSETQVWEQDVAQHLAQALARRRRRQEQRQAEARLKRDHAGCCVLVAEDDLIAGQVMQSLLSAAGLVVDLALSGLQVLERFRAGHHRLILMDMQMPEMDGLTATVQLRHAGVTVPILAMTASDTEEDRQACLEAGMNDFISKPASPERLYAAVLTALGETDATAEARTQALKPEPCLTFSEDAAQADLRAGLLRIEGLDLSQGFGAQPGKLDRYLLLLRDFLGKEQQDLDSTAALISAGKWPEARKRAHTLKGASAMMGMTRLQAAALALEHATRSNPQAALQRLAVIADILADAAQVVAELAG